MLTIMRLRNKILFGFLVFAGIAPIYGRVTEHGYSVANVEDVINLLLAIIATVLPWYLIIKLLVWISDRITGKS